MHDDNASPSLHHAAFRPQSPPQLLKLWSFVDCIINDPIPINVEDLEDVIDSCIILSLEEVTITVSLSRARAVNEARPSWLLGHETWLELSSRTSIRTRLGAYLAWKSCVALMHDAGSKAQPSTRSLGGTVWSANSTIYRLQGRLHFPCRA